MPSPAVWLMSSIPAVSAPRRGLTLTQRHDHPPMSARRATHAQRLRGVLACHGQPAGRQRTRRFPHARRRCRWLVEGRDQASASASSRFTRTPAVPAFPRSTASGTKPALRSVQPASPWEIAGGAEVAPAADDHHRDREFARLAHQREHVDVTIALGGHDLLRLDPGRAHPADRATPRRVRTAACRPPSPWTWRARR